MLYMPFFLMSIFCGALTMTSGSPWYLLPQTTAAVCGVVVMGLELRDLARREWRRE